MKNHLSYALHCELLDRHPPAMRYDPKEDPAAWQIRVRKRLTRLLGLPLEPCSPDFVIEYSQQKPAYTDIRFSFQSEPGYYVPCRLLRPRQEDPKKPVFICLQGHCTGMHVSLGIEKYPLDREDIEQADVAYGAEALRRGYPVVLLEQRNFGECGGNDKEPNCYMPAMTALLLGRTVIGERVWDVQRMIDQLEIHFPDLALDRIACMGLSGGGTATTYLACLEPRIRYIVVAGALCSFRHSIAAMYHCSCNYVPGIALDLDMGDLGGLFAPRKFLDVAGDVDPIFPIEGVTEAYRQIQQVYRAVGAPDACQLLVGHGNHRFFNQEAWDIIDTFFRD